MRREAPPTSTPTSSCSKRGDSKVGMHHDLDRCAKREVLSVRWNDHEAVGPSNRRRRSGRLVAEDLDLAAARATPIEAEPTGLLRERRPEGQKAPFGQRTLVSLQGPQERHAKRGERHLCGS